MNRRILFRTLAILLVTPLFSGCFWFTSREDGDKLKDEVAKLEKKNQDIYKDIEKERAQYTEMIAKAEKQVTELQKVLKEATEVLKHNSADFGADIEQIKNDLRKMEGTLAEFQNSLEVSKQENKALIDAEDKRLEEVARQAGIEVVMDPASIPAKSADLLAAAQKAHDEKRFGEARTYAKIFLQRYPADPKAVDADILIAETHIAQSNYTSAIGSLQKVVDEFPKSDRLPKVYYLMGHSFYMIGSCEDARALLEEVKTKFPKNSFAKNAEQDLKEMKDDKKRRCR